MRILALLEKVAEAGIGLWSLRSYSLDLRDASTGKKLTIDTNSIKINEETKTVRIKVSI